MKGNFKIISKTVRVKFNGQMVIIKIFIIKGRYYEGEWKNGK